MSRAKRNHTHRKPEYAGNNFYIRPTFVVSVPEFVHTDSNRGHVHVNSRRNLLSNQHAGDVSAKAQSKIKNAINWLLQSAKDKRVFDKKSGKNFFFKVNFITLTIPACAQCPPDHFVKTQVFHPFIVYARKYFGLRNYVWRAEAQKNGMIHFHLVTDTFLHHRSLRSSWNKRLQASGLLADFSARHNHENPNSTDVHSVKGIQNLGAYIAKYVSKKDETRRPIVGRLWGCNYELSHNVKTVALCDPDETVLQIRQLINANVVSKELMSKPDAMGQSRRIAELFFTCKDVWRKLRHTLIGQAYAARIFQIRSNIVTMPIDYYTINDAPCQSITQSTQPSGFLQSARASLTEQITSARTAVVNSTQSAIETARNALLSVTSFNKTGQVEIIFG